MYAAFETRLFPTAVDCAPSPMDAAQLRYACQHGNRPLRPDHFYRLSNDPGLNGSGQPGFMVSSRCTARWSWANNGHRR
eukprot:11202973-Lingulodinium_polyedra.AAC.1